MKKALPFIAWLAACTLPASAAEQEVTPQVITHVEGTTWLYARQGTGTYTYFGSMVSEETQTGKAAEIVFDADGRTVYFRQLISQDFEDDTYVVGTIEGDKVRIPAGQWVSYDAEAGRGLRLYHLHIADVEDNEDYDWTYVPDGQDIIFNIDGERLVLDGEVVIDEKHEFPIETIGLIYSDDNNWPGLSDYATVLTPVRDHEVAAPEGMEPEDFIITRQQLNSETGDERTLKRFVKAVVTDNDIWLTSLYQGMPNAWIHGTITDDGKAAFPTRQLLGVGQGNTLYYFLTANTKKEIFLPYPEDPDYIEYTYEHTLTDQVVFDYDAATRTLTTDGTMLINKSADSLMVAMSYIRPTIRPYEAKPATPKMPIVGQYFMPYNEDYGCLYISVAQPVTDVDGELLLTSHLYYRIFVDGQLFTFTAEEYPGIKEVAGLDEMTTVPYGFSDCTFPTMGDFITFLVPGTLIYFYRPEIATIGAQSVYIVDGDERCSDIMTFDLATKTVSITTPVDDARVQPEATPVETVYTDLCGRRTAAPRQGITIRTTRYSDGTTRSEKVTTAR